MRYIKKLCKKEDFLRNSILAVLAVFLGFLIYKKYYVPVANQQLGSGTISKIDPNVFSADEQKLLVPPASSAPQVEIDAHSKLAAKLAVIGSQVEIKDCKAGPIVLQTKLGSPVTFKNTADYNISISFDMDNILKIDAGKSASTTKVFVHGPGLYGYLCQGNGFTGLIGFILVAP